jgi:hypothetical protein
MKSATINYPKAASHAVAFIQAATDTRWSAEERGALDAIARDDRNGGSIHGKGRVYEAMGMRFAVRYAARGIDMERIS